MSLAEREHVFDSPDEWDERDGSGLTYAIARRIVAPARRGAEPAPVAAGNRIELALPAASAAMAAAVEGTPGAGVSAEPTVLVIDDTATNSKLLDAVLAPSGYRVVMASTGQEGLAAAEREQPDLVLLDIRMPDMNGYEVCRRLREDPATAQLPIIMITASGERGEGAGDRGRRRRLRAAALRPGRAARPGAVADQGQAVPRHHRPARPRSWRRGPRPSRRRVAEQLDELDRLRRLRRFLPSQLADVCSGSAIRRAPSLPP